MGIKTKNNRCPCCNKRMYKLKSGQWTHLISEAIEEGYDEAKP